MIVIGWDVSTAAIGVCVKRETGDHEFHVIFPKGKDALAKWRSATEQVELLLSKIIGGSADKVTHVIEQRLGGFTGGLTTKQTLMALAAMNAVVSHHLSFTGEVLHILPITAKSIMKISKLALEGEDKKQTVVRLARTLCPGFPYRERKAGVKGYPWADGVDDMADAWLLVEAGLKVLKGEASIGQPKKASGRKGKARGAEGDGVPQGGVRVRVPRKAGKQRLPKREGGESEALGKSGG